MRGTASCLSRNSPMSFADYCRQTPPLHTKLYLALTVEFGGLKKRPDPKDRIGALLQ